MFAKGQHVMFSKLPGVYTIESSRDVSVQVRVRNVKQRASHKRVYTIKELIDRRGVLYDAFETELEPVNVVRNRSGKPSFPSESDIPRCNAIAPEDSDAGPFLAFVSAMRNDSWF
jgi:hypothetical protein